jgi:hypothetical protein
MIEYGKAHGVSYMEAGEIIAAQEQLSLAPSMAPHFAALLRLQARGVTPRSKDFATEYDRELGAVKRERAAKPAPAAPPPPTKPAAAAVVPRPAIVTQARAAAPVKPGMSEQQRAAIVTVELPKLFAAIYGTAEAKRSAGAFAEAVRGTRIESVGACIQGATSEPEFRRRVNLAAHAIAKQSGAYVHNILTQICKADTARYAEAISERERAA